MPKYKTPDLTDKEILEYIIAHAVGINFGISVYSPSYSIDSREDLIDAIEQHKFEHK